MKKSIDLMVLTEISEENLPEYFWKNILIEDLIFTAIQEKMQLEKYKEMGIETREWLILIMQKLLWKHLKEQILLY